MGDRIQNKHMHSILALKGIAQQKLTEVVTMLAHIIGIALVLRCWALFLIF
jgi:hypothetical protein